MFYSLLVFILVICVLMYITYSASCDKMVKLSVVAILAPLLMLLMMGTEEVTKKYAGSLLSSQ